MRSETAEQMLERLAITLETVAKHLTHLTEQLLEIADEVEKHDEHLAGRLRVLAWTGK